MWQLAISMFGDRADCGAHQMVTYVHSQCLLLGTAAKSKIEILIYLDKDKSEHSSEFHGSSVGRQRRGCSTVVLTNHDITALPSRIPFL